LNKPLLFLVSLYVTVLTGCASSYYGPSHDSVHKPAATNNNENLNSVLWVQAAAEYSATALQTYASARAQLDTAINSKSWTADSEQTSGYEHLPPAIILDVDETVLDDASYQGKLLVEGTDFSLESWDEWISLQQAEAIPGAVEFIEYANDRGVNIFYVTNRECLRRQDGKAPCPQESDTLENLRKVGITDSARAENLLLKNEQPTWGSEKQSRRTHLASRYRILFLFGDNLSDFIPCVKSRNSSNCTDDSPTPAQREQLMSFHADKWGKQWFILPNPMYGSWLRVLPQPRINNVTSYS